MIAGYRKTPPCLRSSDERGRQRHGGVRDAQKDFGGDRKDVFEASERNGIGKRAVAGLA